MKGVLFVGLFLGLLKQHSRGVGSPFLANWDINSAQGLEDAMLCCFSPAVLRRPGLLQWCWGPTEPHLME